jgi:hypothetical protein
MKNLEIKDFQKLLNDDGSLTAIGWARFPYLEPNAESIRIYPIKSLQNLRLKRWQYYAITTPTNFFSFTISHVGYLGLVFAYVVDFEKRTYHEETINTPFGAGVELPKDSSGGVAHYEKGDLKVLFKTETDNIRYIDVNWPKFGGIGLKANLKIVIPKNQESVVNVFPFEKNRFFYTRKVNCMEATGVIEYDKSYNINPENAFGSLDWGFGVWPYKSAWIWGSFSTRLHDGSTLGINLGDKIGNDPRVTDNAVILNGKIYKLGKVKFEYDPEHLEKEWRIKSSDNKLKLTFKPFMVRLARTNLVLLKSVLYQIFGTYSGSFTRDNGEKIEINNVIGWIEEHNARW